MQLKKLKLTPQFYMLKPSFLWEIYNIFLGCGNFPSFLNIQCILFIFGYSYRLCYMDYNSSFMCNQQSVGSKIKTPTLNTKDVIMWWCLVKLNKNSKEQGKSGTITLPFHGEHYGL